MVRFVIICGAVWQILLAVNAVEIEHSIHYRGPPVPEVKSNRTPEVAFIEQRLDNFDPTNRDRWQMRYYQNDEFFVSGGPILIFVGGQWQIGSGFLLGGQVFDIAEQLGGYMFYTEHRYYGLSHPTPDVSVKNMKYLNTEQVLADLAHFITHIRQLHPAFIRSQVILIGGAYAASIVTWFRQQFPHLVAGAWASSASVLGKLDFIEYYEVVGEAFRNLGEEDCFQLLAGAFSQAEQLISDGEFVEFSNLFRTCDVISDDAYDIMEMFGILVQPLTRVVQYHRPGDIANVCASLLETPEQSDIQAYARWFLFRMFGEDIQPDDCVNFSFDDDVHLHRNISWESTAVRRNNRQWFFQTCSEFGWFRTTGGSSIPIDYFLKFCSDVYGELFTVDFIQQQIRRKNVIFGGIRPSVSNVYFTHGSIDPWHPVGILSDLNEFSPVDVIPDASHWQCLGSNELNDSNELRAARARATQLIRKWSGLI